MARVDLKVDLVQLAPKRSAEGSDLDRLEVLRYAREAARRAAVRDPDRFVTIDDVQARLLRSGHGPSALGHAAGSVFRTPLWWATPFRLRSSRPRSRGREVVIWEYLGKRSRSCQPRRRCISMLAADRAFAAEALRKLRHLEAEEALFVSLLKGGENGLR